MKKSKYYRPDIDGLRALAIIPVVLFHAGIAGFSGGFVGVDIFFVISGYLISSIILREMREGKFSLINFWERRVRRIIPVMFFISLVTAIGAYFLVLYPVDFIDFGQSLAAQSVFLANLFFMRKDSYFAAPSESMPLLHMWTLSVEEQFYVFLPLILLAVWWLGKRHLSKLVSVTLLLIAVLSFFYNIYLVEVNPGGIFSIPLIGHIWGSANNLRAGFFFLPARAWEFLLGALLAAVSFSIKKKWLAEVFAASGVVAILYAVFNFSGNTAFPGYAALFPVLGTTLIILSNKNHNTFTGSILSFPAFVWIGLISYSLYLWHWPIIVFSKILFEDISQIHIVLMFLLMVFLSWLSYKFVETPFRTKKLCPKTWQMFLFGFMSVIILAGIGLTIHFAKGMPGRASEAANQIAAASVDVNPRTYECYRKKYTEVFSEAPPCILGEKGGDVDFVLWGDSHSDAAMPIIDLMANEKGETGVYFGDSGCSPLIFWGEYKSKIKEERCEIVKRQALDYIKSNDVNKVLLISAWYGVSDYLEIIDNKRSNDLVREIKNEDDFTLALRETVLLLKQEGADVYIMQRVPIYDFDIRKEFNKIAHYRKKFDPIYIEYDEYLEQIENQTRAFSQLGKEGLIQVIDPTDAFCFEGLCHLSIDGKILYKNGGHINTTGAMRLRPYLEDFFAN